MKRIFYVLLFCIIGIVAGAFLNHYYPLTFSAYFVICMLALALCYFARERVGLLLSWTITATASVLVTLNYLHPDISVYSNADYHVLAVQGIDHKDSIILIGEDSSQSLFDDEDMTGSAYITPSNKGSDCVLHYNLQGEAIFAVVEGNKTGRLINKSQMPSFRNHLSLQNDSMRCDISISTYSKDDSTKVEVTFRHLTQNTYSKYIPSFTQPINIGYNFYDLLHSGVSYSTTEENILNVLRKAVVVRDFDDMKEGIYHMTYPSEIGQLQLICDGHPYQAQNKEQETELSQDTFFYVGIGSRATRPMNAFYQDGNVCLRYRFPYLSNFPRFSDDTSFKENQQKVIAVTTQKKSLLKTNINEAFFYPLFNNEDNTYNFSGNITYRINDSHTPFNAKLTDSQMESLASPNTLISSNGAIWHFKICNLRQESPITGKENIFVKDTTILFCLCLLLFLAFLSVFCPKERKASIMMLVWLFAVPLFVLRLYLLWRIAVFPPVTDITLNEFLRYRMELTDWKMNPMLITIGVWLMLTIMVFSLPPKPQEFLHKFWKKQGWNTPYLWFFVLSLVGSLCLALYLYFSHNSNVGANILIPVVLFLINEYIAIRRLNLYYRIANAIVALLALLISDPGYAIMFFIFECIYYAIILYGYLRYKSSEVSSRKLAAVIIYFALSTCIASIIFLPNIVSLLYSSNPSPLGISVSRLSFIILPIILGLLILVSIWIWMKLKPKKGLLGIAIVLLLTIISGIWGYDYFQEKNLHFKYRTIIHTQTVGEIMQDERYDHRNSQRLLNAAQNQWFLQHHFNKGSERIHDDGILSLLPHFKKGVTWNTQISDVLLSRYVIGELSGLVPLVMILFALLFLLIVFHYGNPSPAGRALTYAIALLFLVQSTFEWMAVTNRTIFFGQDFPFLSQNSRYTLVMFGIWLMLLIYFGSHKPHREYDLELRDSQRCFLKTIPQINFFVLFFFIVGFIFFKGNHYDSLYADEKSQGDKSNAEEFNISTAMTESAYQLTEINARLAEYPVTGKKLENNEDITLLVQDIEEKTHLNEYVEMLKDDGRINEFTYSLYQAFIKNLKRRNSNNNIIHLRHHDLEKYELALNKSYFSLQSPDFYEKAWRGNIYSQVSSPLSQKSLVITELPGISIYSIPKSWVPPHMDFAIVDNRVKNGHSGENYQKVVHKEMNDYDASMAVFPVTPQDILELKDKKSLAMLTYQYGREEQDILVKNMIINGKRQFFYPMKDRLFWLRDFSNLVAYSKQGSSSNDSVYVTLDSKLTEIVMDSLRYYVGKECSVVALDGRGNVRLMADYKPSGNIDPNNEELINELAIQSYMNPSPETDQNLFGNLNLCYMKPGPGSSLKPITYASVTSQSQDINWPGLELMSPSQIKDSTVSKVAGKYYHVRKYGPQYKYSVQRPFKSLINDEKGDGMWIDNNFYLYKSSNYYNALITYLGHYDDLKDAQSNIFIVSSNINDFPRFRTEKGGTIYTFRNSPSAVSNQLLFDGLTKNFKIPTYIGNPDTLRYEFVDMAYYKKNNLESKQRLSSYFSWVYPQESTIYDYEMRDSVLTPAERLRQYTLGSDPVKVTPMKMAEMYGKLYSQHPDFHATVTPRVLGFKEPWLDRNGNASDDFFSFYQKNLFNGMANCVKIGTASNLTHNNKGYHFYAKTGTLSLGEGYHDDRMLAVIISNKDLMDDGDNKVKSPDDYKFMVVYFRFKQLDPGSEVFWKTVNSVIKSILDSNSFKLYMKSL